MAPRIWQVIDNAPVVTAVTHKDADGDTLGSALALALALEPIGKSVPVVSSPPVPQAWWFLPGFERVNQQSAPPDTPVFIFDASDASRAGAYAAAVAQAKVVVNIDHHVSNKQFGSINLVRTEAVPTFKRDIADAYEKATGLPPQIFVTPATEGAGKVQE